VNAEHLISLCNASSTLRCGRAISFRKFFLLVALIAFGALLAIPDACAAEHSLKSFSSDAILDKVQKRIFFEFGPNAAEIFARWTDDIHIGIVSDGSISPDILRTFLLDLAEVQLATNHNMALFGKTPNLVVFFSQDLDKDVENHDDLLSQFFLARGLVRQYFESYKQKKSTCTSKSVLASNRAIAKSLLFVSVSADHSPADINECLARSLLNSLGVIGAFNEDFFPEDAGPRISELDKMTLQLLYNPQMPLGSDKNSALPEMRRLLEATLGRN
jgi:hypothetical protein